MENLQENNIPSISDADAERIADSLAAALEKHGIPCRLEIGPTGGHGFADATGMCMAGWTERAVRWYESLQRHQE